MTTHDHAWSLSAAPQQGADNYRGDHLLVAQMVEQGSRVLDVGCGEGDLLRLLESRGGSIGPNESGLFDIIRPLYGAAPTDLFTGDIKQVLTAEWANTCGYVIRQTSPYPLTVLGVIPDVDVGT